MSRYFSVEEANQALEVNRPLVAHILRVRAAILARSPEIWPIIEKAAGNGGSKAATQIEREFEKVDAAVRQIQALGAIFKDINTGLVDFPALREGREVYLCWRYGEDEVRHWHETDAGVSGRQPI